MHRTCRNGLGLSMKARIQSVMSLVRWIDRNLGVEWRSTEPGIPSPEPVRVHENFFIKIRDTIDLKLTYTLTSYDHEEDPANYQGRRRKNP